MVVISLKHGSRQPWRTKGSQEQTRWERWWRSSSERSTRQGGPLDPICQKLGCSRGEVVTLQVACRARANRCSNAGRRARCVCHGKKK